MENKEPISKCFATNARDIRALNMLIKSLELAIRV